MSPFPGLGGALALLAAALAAQAGAAVVVQMVAPGVDRVLLAGVANLAALSAVAAWGYAHSREAPRFRPVSGAGPGFWPGLILTVWGGTVVLGELANGITWVYPVSPAVARLFNDLSGGNLVLSLFTAALVAPLTEEALFRGLLLRGFARRWGAGPALFLSSAFFALFHLNVWQGPSAFVAGLFLGWLFLRTGSLFYPVAAHALFNALPVVLGSWVTVRGYNSPLVPGVAEFQPPLWLAAGALALTAGLILTRRWAPLSPVSVSDTVAP